MKYHYIFSLFALLIITTQAWARQNPRNDRIACPAKPEDIHLRGELMTRLNKNFDRLETDIYQPDSVFRSVLSVTWPGDCPGRLVLGQVCDARATGREARYLDTILERYPLFMNQDGYFGPLYDGTQVEQQMSGNGWVLRGLCEYYEWKKDERVLTMIKNMVNNYFMKSKGIYKDYPIDPDERKKGVGGVIGEETSKLGDWILSSDIGSVFNGMDGLIHAYSIIGGDDLREVVEELVDRFLEIDLAGIKAQTHASLTACRGVLRYATLTGNTDLVSEIEKRWDVYRECGMTPGYENFNWFCREDTWSEPCAVVDSYLLATQLWQLTGKKDYLDDAERIYYNGICHAQRANGGFGCDACPSEQTGVDELSIRMEEAYWCCTMRGGEGLGCAEKYTFFTRGRELFLTNYRDCRYDTGDFALEESTSYPFDNKVVLKIVKNKKAVNTLMLNIPVNTSNLCVSVNGKILNTKEVNGFCRLSGKLKAGDQIEISFEMPQVTLDDGKAVRYFKGPLILGRSNDSEELSPIYHMMDSSVYSAAGYHKKILF